MDLTEAMSVNTEEISYIDVVESEKSGNVFVSQQSEGSKCWSQMSGSEKKAIRDRYRENNRKFLEKIKFLPKVSHKYGHVT